MPQPVSTENNCLVERMWEREGVGRLFANDNVPLSCTISDRRISSASFSRYPEPALKRLASAVRFRPWPPFRFNNLGFRPSSTDGNSRRRDRPESFQKTPARIGAVVGLF